jgi:FixJ family two-component response regulator
MTAGQTTGARLISIVDDDPSVRDGIVDLVTALGFDAQAFAHAEHFLQSGDFERTSCLITDVRTPGITGLELHDRLVASGTLIPTIVMTAYPTEVDRRRAMQAGVTCYMAKPIDNDELVFCIWSALASGAPAKR